MTFPDGQLLAECKVFQSQIGILSELKSTFKISFVNFGIDIITSIKGLEYAEIWKNRIKGPYGTQTINFIDRQNLIRTKKLSNRAQDKADLKLPLS